MQIGAAFGDFAEDCHQHDAVKAAVGEGEAVSVAMVVAYVGDVAFVEATAGDGEHFRLDVCQYQFALRHGARQRRAEVAGAAADFKDAAVRGEMQSPQQFRRREDQRPQRDEQGERQLRREKLTRLGQTTDDIFQAGARKITSVV